MSKFDEQLSRMRALCTYGTVNEDNKKQSNYTLEYHATAADGKEYGIIKECSRFYIKSTTPDKKTVAESYQYIGGWANKKDYEYESYNNALKNFELKLESINEAHDSKVNVETLDPFKKEDLVVEGTEKMKNEIARQRQIMYNAAMLMNESTDYAVKGGKACSTSQPEAETGAKGDKAEGSKEAKADPNYKGSHISLDKKAAPFEENPKGINEVASPTEGDFDEGAKPFGTTQNGEADTEHNNAPFTENPSVNEETNDWASEGLPSSAGVGEADTDHNNDPFNKSVNEADEDDAEDVESDVPAEGDAEGEDDFDFDALMDDEDAVADDEGAIADDEDALADDEGALADDEEVVADDETDFPSVGDGDELGAMGEDDDIMAKIADLEAQLAALKAEVGGGEDAATDTDLDAGVEDVDGGVGEEGDFGADLAGDGELGDEGMEGADEFGDEPDFEGEDDFGGEDDFDDVHESKKAIMNRIVESVVRQMLSEDELHDFGKHPGYRKKPMDLPPTGEDKNEHGEDINDDSVHNEEPFGKQIGDGSPFNQLVDAVTKDVMYQLKKGIPIEGENKKEDEDKKKE